MRLRLLLLGAVTLFLGGISPAKGQGRVALKLLPVFHSQRLALGQQIATQAGPLIITRLRFYLSGLCLMRDGHTVWAEEESYHLVDAADSASRYLSLAVPQGIVYDALAFNLGIDSTTNAHGAKGGVLDPALGMYWAWHSGYINLKLEGISPLCPTRKHLFEYHLGGFRTNEYALQRITLPTRSGREITIRVDVATFLDAVDLAAEPAVMSPGERSNVLSKKAAGMFTLFPMP